jgi:hypothetical protein
MQMLEFPLNLQPVHIKGMLVRQIKVLIIIIGPSEHVGLASLCEHDHVRRSVCFVLRR